MTCPGYQKLSERSREIHLVRSTAALLEWDLETYIPPNAAAFRAEQLSYLGTKAHALFTKPIVGQWIKEAEDFGFPAESPEAANVREWRRAYDRAVKIPNSLVEKFEKARIIAYDTWISARAESNFLKFRPHLEKLIALVRKKIDRWGFEESPYDALLEDYEPGVRASQLKPVFAELREALKGILGNAKTRDVPENFLDGDYPTAGQQTLSKEIAEALGYDFRSGRIDTTTHPFMTTLGPCDQRITTRYNEKRFEMSLYGTMHETGHALYEQGLPKEPVGLPTSDSVSLGIHESQSRLWENHVGRSSQFWQLWHATACKHLPDLARYSPDDLARGVQRVAPSFIRVEADEVTYDLHILLRFEIELDLIEGRLNVKDLPEAWNSKFKEVLDLDVPDDRRGVLQDVHWSHGTLGYFPTYTLGNLNAAQLMNSAEAQVPDLAGQLSQGRYQPLLQWLREKVHQHGRHYLPQDLMRRATGETTQAKYRIEYLRQKYVA
jgi:carboxypeptidase Taq